MAEMPGDCLTCLLELLPGSLLLPFISILFWPQFIGVKALGIKGLRVLLITHNTALVDSRERKSHSMWGRCNPKQGFGFIVSRWFRSGSWNRLGKSTVWKWDSSYSSPVMHCWTRGIQAEKCMVRRFHVCATITECTYTNLDGLAYYTWRLNCRACFSQVQPVQHATIQNNMGLNQAENNII